MGAAFFVGILRIIVRAREVMTRGDNFQICGKKISNGPIFKLIEQGKTSLIKGFKNKDGSKEFDAYLVVDKNQI